MRPIPATSAAWIVLAATAQTQTLTLTFDDALARARQYAPALLEANLATRIAHEDTVQAKAALLPNASALSQFIYTQPNGTDTGVFVANNGPRVYNQQLTLHGDLYAPEKLAGFHGALVAEVLARAKADLAARGLVATVVQDYYGMAVAVRKLGHAQQALREAADFLAIAQKQEQGGEVAHSDVVKAQLQLEQRRADLQNAQLALGQARIGFSVLLFPDFNQDFTVADDLDKTISLPEFAQVETMAGRNNPEIRAAQAAVEQQQFAIHAARAGLLPTLSFDYFFGLDANQFALHNTVGQNNLGSAAQVQLEIPLWTWGAARSRVRQAEFRFEQAKVELTATQRQLLANLHAFYLEADTANGQIATLRRSLDLAAESLRLTLLRYQAGEVTVLEVVDAQFTLIQARSALDDGLARYRLALADLQTLTGVF